MRAPRRDSELTRAAILKAARRLFAEEGIPSVSVRDIAREAGVTHGLVHHYFGTKEELAEEVIRREITFTSDMLASSPLAITDDATDEVRKIIRHFFTDGRESVLLMARAELSHLEPESLAPEGAQRPLQVMTRHLSELQAKTGSERPCPDPALITVFLGAAIVGLILVHPWLFTSAGLRPEDYERRLDEIIEMGVSFVAQSVGIAPESPAR